MDKLMYEAAVEGNVNSLLCLFKEDALLLDRFMVGSYLETPLHIASMLGHTPFVQEILRRKPELASELDHRKLSPLHSASAKGFLDIVKMLVSVNPEMCFVCDRDGRNPLHIASMKGHVAVLRELIQVRPQAARSLMDRDESILHLSVRYNQLEAMKFLVDTINDHEFLNSKDDYGNNILHLAVIDKQVETVKFLTTNSTIEVNALNGYGITALDILTQSIKDVKYWEIGEMLRRAGAISARDIQSSPNDLGTSTTQARILRSHESHNQITSLHPQSTNGSKKCDDWLEKRRNTLMVVASLLATMGFQAGLTPPGGLWQDNFIGNGHELPPHSAGFPIMADFDRSSYEIFMAFNSIGFMVSLTIILLLISGLPWFRRTFFMWILTVMMWVAIFAMALAYRVSISTLVTMHTSYLTELVVQTMWCFLLLHLLLLGHMIRLTFRMIKFLIKSVKKAIRRSSSTNGHEEQHDRV